MISEHVNFDDTPNEECEARDLTVVSGGIRTGIGVVDFYAGRTPEFHSVHVHLDKDQVQECSVTEHEDFVSVSVGNLSLYMELEQWDALQAAALNVKQPRVITSKARQR